MDLLGTSYLVGVVSTFHLSDALSWLQKPGIFIPVREKEPQGKPTCRCRRAEDDKKVLPRIQLGLDVSNAIGEDTTENRKERQSCYPVA
jgi:hypothetical protein